MVLDQYYYKILPIYDGILSCYKEELFGFSYYTKELTRFERVIVIEDTLIVYFGLRESNPEDLIERRKFNVEFFDGNYTSLYYIQIEELTANEILKFNFAKFKRKIEEIYQNVNTYYFLNYVRFTGEGNIYGRLAHSAFDCVNTALPSLHLKKRLNEWTGWLYYFIIFEVYDFDNLKAYCICHTKDSSVNKVARRRCLQVAENMRFVNNSGLTCSSNFNELRKSIRTYFVTNKRKHTNLFGKISYVIIKQYIKNENDIESYTQKYLNKAQNGEFTNQERVVYEEYPVKWKSEYLVKDLCEQIYGKNDVIYQHRPFFLLTNKCQLSYDVYLKKEKIAIEYQGKQHFEPVEYFGGEKAFLKQQERDRMKQQLSKENNVKLIYISYNEDISKELIIEKVNDVKKQ